MLLSSHPSMGPKPPPAFTAVFLPRNSTLDLQAHFFLIFLSAPHT